MLSQEQVMDIARAVASERGWPWSGRVIARRSRPWLFFGAPRWEVLTNADCRGCNACILIDDATGAVVAASFLPR
jgi:hypothetical protein